MTFEDWLPMSPTEGPPLPRFLGVRWPWLPPRPAAELWVLAQEVIAYPERQPVPSVDVRLDTVAAGTTDAQGWCLLRRLSPGQYVLTLSKAGYQTYTTSVTLVAGTNSISVGIERA